MKSNYIPSPSIFYYVAIYVHLELLSRTNEGIILIQSYPMKDFGVVAVMLVAELLEVMVNTVSKAAMRKGMNDFLFVMYSNAFAACFLIPLTLTFYRKRTLPPLTYCIIGQLLALGLLSCGLQMLTLFGIGYSSPTLASVMSDLVPGFTFILAILCRMEKFDCKANSTRAKSFGALVSITGALIVTLYKGMPITNNHLSHKLFPQLVSSVQLEWIFGAMLLGAHSCIRPILFIVQTWIIREYPAELMIALISCVLVSILSVPASLISEKDPKVWRLGFNMELVAIACSAVFNLSFKNVVHIWAIGKRGPVFVALFKPLEIVFAIIMGITFLGDALYLGSVIGAAIVVVGFYAVIWGKTQEEKVQEDSTLVYSSSSYSPEVPLLQSKAMKE